jgi:hypothetical protein
VSRPKRSMDFSQAAKFVIDVATGLTRMTAAQRKVRALSQTGGIAEINLCFCANRRVRRGILAGP